MTYRVTLAYALSVFLFYVLVVMDSFGLMRFVLFPVLGEEHAAENMVRTLIWLPIFCVIGSIVVIYLLDRFAAGRTGMRNLALALCLAAAAASVLIAMRNVKASESFWIGMPILILGYVALSGFLMRLFGLFLGKIRVENSHSWLARLTASTP